MAAALARPEPNDEAVSEILARSALDLELGTIPLQVEHHGLTTSQ